MALKCDTVAYPAGPVELETVPETVPLCRTPPDVEAHGADSTRLTKQYTPMSSRGRDLYPSLHTRHTSPPVRSSSSSSEMSSMPSMLLGDIAEASKSRAPEPSGEPVGVA